MPRYTLHVAYDQAHPTRYDIGSMICIAVAQRLTAPSHPEVRTVVCSARDRSPQLTGTPTLHEVDDAEPPRCGFEAIEFLLDLLAAPRPEQAATPPAPTRRRPASSSRSSRTVTFATPPVQDHEREEKGEAGGKAATSGDDGAEASSDDDDEDRKVTDEDMKKYLQSRQT